MITLKIHEPKKPIEEQVYKFLAGEEVPFDPGYFDIPRGKKALTARAMLLMRAGLERIMQEYPIHKEPETPPRPLEMSGIPGGSPFDEIDESPPIATEEKPNLDGWGG